MMDLARYDDLVGRIYDGATDASTWPEIVERIARAVGASRAVLYTFMHGPERGGFCVTYNLPQEQLEAWAERSRADDPFVQAVLDRRVIVNGAVWEGCQLVPRPKLIQSRLYQDIWLAWDIEHLCLGIVFDGSDSKMLPTSLSLFRTPRDASFTAAEIEIVRRLVVHLSRAIGVMFHLRDANHALAASRAALDRLSGAVVLLGAERRVQYANARAMSLLQRGDLLQLVPSHVGESSPSELSCTALTADSAAAFRRAIDRALDDPSIHKGHHFSDAIILYDKNRRPCAVLNAATLGAKGYASADGVVARAVVFIYPIDHAGAVAPQTLRQLFGLTPAEAQAALALPEGGSQAEVAQRLGVSINTLKSQLKVVYAKTQTQRRADLLKLLSALSLP